MRTQNLLIGALLLLTFACNSGQKADTKAAKQEPATQNAEDADDGVILLEAESFTGQADGVSKSESAALIPEGAWASYTIQVPETGRYQVKAYFDGADSAQFWVEDYINNPDGRTYNITGMLTAERKSVDGSPMAEGTHQIKIHADKSPLKVDKVEFTLIKKHEYTPESLTQQTNGQEWNVVWADEFDGEKIDQTKWTYDVGDWGWGNFELQYYTEADEKNARIEDGKLIIEAHKNPDNERWTSARLTTRGKTSFLYGKIEFMAKVPRERGNWAAGWTLGDDYRDEKSWPYCGEIDIMESVGYEVDDETGDGIAHCTVHTPAYYFKINNQISSTKEVEDIADAFHTYAVEWTPTEVKGFVDGEHYYTYDKTANDKEWPFNKPQNIILNLAMGGGWGGAKGVDPNITSQKLIIDYVRVYEKK